MPLLETQNNVNKTQKQAKFVVWINTRLVFKYIWWQLGETKPIYIYILHIGTWLVRFIFDWIFFFVFRNNCLTGNIIFSLVYVSDYFKYSKIIRCSTLWACQWFNFIFDRFVVSKFCVLEDRTILDMTFYLISDFENNWYIDIMSLPQRKQLWTKARLKTTAASKFTCIQFNPSTVVHNLL